MCVNHNISFNFAMSSSIHSRQVFLGLPRPLPLTLEACAGRHFCSDSRPALRPHFPQPSRTHVLCSCTLPATTQCLPSPSHVAAIPAPFPQHCVSLPHINNFIVWFVYISLPELHRAQVDLQISTL